MLGIFVTLVWLIGCFISINLMRMIWLYYVNNGNMYSLNTSMVCIIAIFSWVSVIMLWIYNYDAIIWVYKNRDNINEL